MSKFSFRPPSFATVVAVAMFVCTAARAAEPAACIDLERTFSPKSELSSLQINVQLSRAADLGCIHFARTLLDAGGSVEARDRQGAMPLAPDTSIWCGSCSRTAP